MISGNEIPIILEGQVSWCEQSAVATRHSPFPRTGLKARISSGSMSYEVFSWGSNSLRWGALIRWWVTHLGANSSLQRSFSGVNSGREISHRVPLDIVTFYGVSIAMINCFSFCPILSHLPYHKNQPYKSLLSIFFFNWRVYFLL